MRCNAVDGVATFVVTKELQPASDQHFDSFWKTVSPSIVVSRMTPALASASISLSSSSASSTTRSLRAKRVRATVSLNSQSPRGEGCRGGSNAIDQEDASGCLRNVSGNKQRKWSVLEADSTLDGIAKRSEPLVSRTASHLSQNSGKATSAPESVASHQQPRENVDIHSRAHDTGYPRSHRAGSFQSERKERLEQSLGPSVANEEGNSQSSTRGPVMSQPPDDSAESLVRLKHRRGVETGGMDHADAGEIRDVPMDNSNIQVGSGSDNLANANIQPRREPEDFSSNRRCRPEQLTMRHAGGPSKGVSGRVCCDDEYDCAGYFKAISPRDMATGRNCDGKHSRTNSISASNFSGESNSQKSRFESPGQSLPSRLQERAISGSETVNHTASGFFDSSNSSRVHRSRRNPRPRRRQNRPLQDFEMAKFSSVGQHPAVYSSSEAPPGANDALSLGRRRVFLCSGDEGNAPERRTNARSAGDFDTVEDYTRQSAGQFKVTAIDRELGVAEPVDACDSLRRRSRRKHGSRRRFGAAPPTMSFPNDLAVVPRTRSPRVSHAVGDFYAANLGHPQSGEAADVETNEHERKEAASNCSGTRWNDTQRTGRFEQHLPTPGSSRRGARSRRRERQRARQALLRHQMDRHHRSRRPAVWRRLAGEFTPGPVGVDMAADVPHLGGVNRYPPLDFGAGPHGLDVLPPYLSWDESQRRGGIGVADDRHHHGEPSYTLPKSPAGLDSHNPSTPAVWRYQLPPESGNSSSRSYPVEAINEIPCAACDSRSNGGYGQLPTGAYCEPVSPALHSSEQAVSWQKRLGGSSGHKYVASAAHERAPVWQASRELTRIGRETMEYVPERPEQLLAGPNSTPGPQFHDSSGPVLSESPDGTARVTNWPNGDLDIGISSESPNVTILESGRRYESPEWRAPRYRRDSRVWRETPLRGLQRVEGAPSWPQHQQYYDYNIESSAGRDEREMLLARREDAHGRGSLQVSGFAAITTSAQRSRSQRYIGDTLLGAKNPFEGQYRPSMERGDDDRARRPGVSVSKRSEGGCRRSLGRSRGSWSARGRKPRRFWEPSASGREHEMRQQRSRDTRAAPRHDPSVFIRPRAGIGRRNRDYRDEIPANGNTSARHHHQGFRWSKSARSGPARHHPRPSLRLREREQRRMRPSSSSESEVRGGRKNETRFERQRSGSGSRGGGAMHDRPMSSEGSRREGRRRLYERNNRHPYDYYYEPSGHRGSGFYYDAPLRVPSQEDMRLHGVTSARRRRRRHSSDSGGESAQGGGFDVRRSRRPEVAVSSRSSGRQYGSSYRGWDDGPKKKHSQRYHLGKSYRRPSSRWSSLASRRCDESLTASRSRSNSSRYSSVHFTTYAPNSVDDDDDDTRAPSPEGSAKGGGKDGSVDITHFDWFPGMRLGDRFIVMSQLGEGTFGRVLECKDLADNRIVAIKVVRDVGRYTCAAEVEAKILEQLSRCDPEKKSNCVELVDKFFIDTRAGSTSSRFPMERSPRRFRRSMRSISAARYHREDNEQRNHYDSDIDDQPPAPPAPVILNGPLSSSEKYQKGVHMCLVSEKLGLSLFNYLCNNKFRGFFMKDIQCMAREALRGLSYLDKLELTHTDVKPENILFIDDSSRSVPHPRANAHPRFWDGDWSSEGEAENDGSGSTRSNLLRRRSSSRSTRSSRRQSRVDYECEDSSENLKRSFQRSSAGPPALPTLRRSADTHGPDNWNKDCVIVNRPLDCRVKLIDFGWATFRDEDHSSLINTRQYRAPEVILQTGWSNSSDLWSFGCLLVELYTGMLLFRTHQHMEHLALMEAIIGPFPQSMLQQAAKGEGAKYVTTVSQNPYLYRLKWPQGASSPRSISRVAKSRPLEDLFLPGHVELGKFVRYILELDPAVRPTAAEALKHPFLGMQIPESNNSS